VQDTEPGEALSDLGRRHRGAVVAQRRAWRTALLERLCQAVRDDLCGLGQIPLQMAGEPRSVVENAEQDWGMPITTRGEYLSSIRGDSPSAIIR
jgi:hypothetical protein